MPSEIEEVAARLDPWFKNGVIKSNGGSDYDLYVSSGDIDKAKTLVEMDDRVSDVRETGHGIAFWIGDAERTYLVGRAGHTSLKYGFKIPAGAPHEIKARKSGWRVLFHNEDDVSDLESWSTSERGFDRGAYVSHLETVTE